MDVSKTKNAIDNNIPHSPEKAMDDVVQSLNTVLEDMFALNFGPDHFYQGLTFKRGYYAGGTLCLDTNKEIIVMLNIASETFTLQPISAKEHSSTNIMPLKLLWIAFYVYLTVKGKTNYYMDCYGESCIRHLYDDNMEDLSKKEDIAWKFEDKYNPALN